MDYHKILGTRPGDNLDKIKSAYRRKAALLHPDKGGSDQQFAQLHEAYEQAKRTANQRVNIPVTGNLDLVRVTVPLDRLIRAGCYQFTFKDKAIEVDLPNWHADWAHEHSFVLKDHNIKLLVKADHQQFWIQDKELATRVDITNLESLVGCEKNVLGKKIEIPAGSVTGDQMRIPGLGLFNGTGYADLSCIFNIIPVQLTDGDFDLSLKQLQEKYRKY